MTTVVSEHYTPQAYPLWAWSKTDEGGLGSTPRLVIGWAYPRGVATPVFAPTEEESGLLFRFSPFDPNAITAT